MKNIVLIKELEHNGGIIITETLKKKVKLPIVVS